MTTEKTPKTLAKFSTIYNNKCSTLSWIFPLVIIEITWRKRISFFWSIYYRKEAYNSYLIQRKKKNSNK